MDEPKTAQQFNAGMTGQVEFISDGSKSGSVIKPSWDGLLQELAKAAKELMYGMDSRTRRLPDTADFLACFRRVSAEKFGGLV